MSSFTASTEWHLRDLELDAFPAVDPRPDGRVALVNSASWVVATCEAQQPGVTRGTRCGEKDRGSSTVLGSVVGIGLTVTDARTKMVPMMHCGALKIEIHIPASGSLKEKRKVVKHLVESARTRFGVAASEVGHQERWQRSELGFAAVGSSPGQVEEVLRTVERYVWSHPEIEIVGQQTCWLENDV